MFVNSVFSRENRQGCKRKCSFLLLNSVKVNENATDDGTKLQETPLDNLGHVRCHKDI